jgi:hypothetical protein
MPQLHTKLSADECIRRLRDQVQSQSILSRLNIFRPGRSRVTGHISHDQFSLESSTDRFSKRFVGRFIPQKEGLIIDYTWQVPITHRVYGDSEFDETEILSFLVVWLDVEPV